MLTALLVIISLSFIGEGLPDSVLGVAWPSMYRELGLPISAASYISMAVSVGTIISSLAGAWLIKRLGTGLLVALSALFTAAALFGFAFTEEPVFFFVLALPLGLGAGAIDAGLNAFVANHYSASQMSFLHCFYGVGVVASPFIMSLALGEAGNWRRGYFIVAVIQLAITAVSFAALPIWKRVGKRDKEERAEQRTLSVPELIRTRGVIFSTLAFFTYCALELTAGSWSASYFAETKGLSADSAAGLTMLFYIGLSLGRVASGFLAGRVGRRRILKISLAVLVLSVFLFALPLPLAASAAALFLIGFSAGPVYPNLVHLTPKLFGEDISASVMGLQQAMTYLGIMIMPPLFGILAEVFSMALLPYYLIAMLVLYAAAFFALMGSVGKSRSRGRRKNKI